MTEPENLILHMLRDMRANMATKHDIADLATKADLAALATNADLQAEVNSLRADVASDLLAIEKRLGERITHLNRAVIEYHSSIIGHGVLLSELDERVRRLEAKVNV